jgi:hemerythrin superfamily protein
MNVIDLLVRDHENVSELFRACEELDRNDPGARRAVLERLHLALEQHAAAEEQLFYPALRARVGGDEEGEDSVDEAREEHRVVRELLSELVELEPSEQTYDAKLKVLKDMVEHHVGEEESLLLPLARDLMPQSELEQIGAQVEGLRLEMRTRGLAAGPANAGPDARPQPLDDVSVPESARESMRGAEPVDTAEAGGHAPGSAATPTRDAKRSRHGRTSPDEDPAAGHVRDTGRDPESGSR